jgi:hypothetical protein
MQLTCYVLALLPCIADILTLQQFLDGVSSYDQQPAQQQPSKLVCFNGCSENTS